MPQVEKIFGMVLRELRQGKGFSQENLGFEAGFHRTYVSQLERGQKSPSLNAVFRLAAALKINPSAFIAKVEQRVGKVA